MKSNEKIIPAQAADIGTLAEIEFANMSRFIEPHDEWNPEFVRKSIRENLDRAWVLAGPDVSGFYCWAPDKDCAVLLSIQVREALQGKGYGTKLLNHFQGQAEEHGFYKLGLAVHRKNRAYEWYTRHGYQYVEDDGPDCHVLIKELNSKEF